MLRAMRGFLGENDMMAYLAMMAARLIELHRVLKPTAASTCTATRPRATT
jgi:site-specific DNA-methyltransferase (adenine-specific)